MAAARGRNSSSYLYSIHNQDVKYKLPSKCIGKTEKFVKVLSAKKAGGHDKQKLLRRRKKLCIVMVWSKNGNSSILNPSKKPARPRTVFIIENQSGRI